MNVASRLARRALIGSKHVLRPRTPTYSSLMQWNRFGVRSFSTPIAPKGKFNIIQRKGHGLMNYMMEWEALIFCHKEYRWATFWISSSSFLGVVVMIWCLFNSVYNDPEVRTRPHKKAWQFSEENIARGEKYRGAFKWYPGNGNRVEYNRRVMREGLGVAGFEEPGQIGWEENPIPKLDDEDTWQQQQQEEEE